MQTFSKNRTLSFDVMNILACLAVITLHHHTHYHHFETSLSWGFSLLTECCFFWAVPVFLMLSGANLLGYHEKYGLNVFLKRRFLRTVIPWFVWSILLLIWKICTGQFVPESDGLPYYFQLIVTNKVDATYWYFSTLFTCYLMIPMLTYITPHRKVLWYFTGVTFALSSVFPWLKTWFGFNQSMVKGIHEPLLIFVLLGYLLNTTEFTKKQRLCIYAGGLIGVLYRIIHTLILSLQNGATASSIGVYASWHSVLLASAVFVFLKHVKWEQLLPEKLKKALPSIAACSFGIYLFHKIPLYHIRAAFGFAFADMTWKTVFIPVTYLVSLLTVWLIRKIPVIGKYIC